MLPKEIEIQRLKLYIGIRLMFSLTLAAVISYYIDTSINQTIILDSAFTPANWLAAEVVIDFH